VNQGSHEHEFSQSETTCYTTLDTWNASLLRLACQKRK
jgi:hypothetical protein